MKHWIGLVFLVLLLAFDATHAGFSNWNWRVASRDDVVHDSEEIFNHIKDATTTTSSPQPSPSTPNATTPTPTSTTTSQTSTPTSTIPETKPTPEMTDIDLLRMFAEIHSIMAHGTDSDNETSTNSKPTPEMTDIELLRMFAEIHNIMAHESNGDNETSTNSLSTPQMGNVTEQEENSTAESTPLTKNDKPCAKEGKQYKSMCDLVQSYDIVQRHWPHNNKVCAVSFHLKSALHRTGLWAEIPTRFVVRYQRETIDGTHFLLVEQNPTKKTITIGPLPSGSYMFQICMVTEAFQPNLTDNDQFSWVKQAPAYFLELQLSQQEKHDSAAFDRKSEKVAW